MEDKELENDEELEEELQEDEESEFIIPEEENFQEEIEHTQIQNTAKDNSLDYHTETDHEMDLNIDENNNLNEIVKLDSKGLTKEIQELNNRMDSEFSNDMIVCGKCNTDFQLSEIVLFIEHKASKCAEPKTLQKLQSNSDL